MIGRKRKIRCLCERTIDKERDIKVLWVARQKVSVRVNSRPSKCAIKRERETKTEHLKVKKPVNSRDTKG